MIYVSPATHRKIRMLAAREGRTMGQVVGRLADQRIAFESNPWIEGVGLSLQGEALARVWDDPELDMFDDDSAAPR